MGSSGSSIAAPSSCGRRPAKDTVQNFRDKYVLGPKLGEGGFAVVYAINQIHDDISQASKRKAVKVLTRTTQTSKKKIFLEEELWFAVGHHNNCVRLYEVFHGASCSYMVMERCDCSLHHYIKNMFDLTERTLGPILLQMLRSLYQVHSCHIVHRDIKPDNYLIGGADGQTVKLCDFGLSIRLLEGSKQLSTIAGTAPFMCPEMVLRKGYDFKADVWSVGVIAYACLFGIFPYMPKTSRRMKKAIAEGVPPTFTPVERHTTNGSQFRSSTALDFVRSLLSREPEQRPSVIVASNMEYMTSTANCSHALTEDLPSLRPMISSAQKLGVFTCQDDHMQVDLDNLLNDLHKGTHQKAPVKTCQALAKTTCRKDSKDTLSDSMSMPSTACPSENPSRTPSKTSATSRQDTEMENLASGPNHKVFVNL